MNSVCSNKTFSFGMSSVQSTKQQGFSNSTPRSKNFGQNAQSSHLMIKMINRAPVCKFWISYCRCVLKVFQGFSSPYIMLLCVAGHRVCMNSSFYGQHTHVYVAVGSIIHIGATVVHRHICRHAQHIHSSV